MADETTRTVLTVQSWVAFAGPRTTTGVGVVLLTAVAMPQLLLLTDPWPGYVRAWSVVAVVVALLAVTTMIRARSGAVAALGWTAGSVLCAVSMVLWIVSRIVELPGVAGTVGRWDHPGATAVLGLAAVYLLVYVSLLLGVTVARPGRRHWND